MVRCFLFILLTFAPAKISFANASANLGLGIYLLDMFHQKFKDRGLVNCNFISEQVGIQNKSLEYILDDDSPCADLPGLPKIEQFEVKLKDKSFQNQAKINLIDRYILYSLDYMRRNLSERHKQFTTEINFLDEYIKEGKSKPSNIPGEIHHPVIEEMFKAVNTYRAALKILEPLEEKKFQKCFVERGDYRPSVVDNLIPYADSFFYMDEINHEVKKCEEKLDQSIAPVKQIISNLKTKYPFLKNKKIQEHINGISKEDYVFRTNIGAPGWDLLRLIREDHFQKTLQITGEKEKIEREMGDPTNKFENAEFGLCVSFPEEWCPGRDHRTRKIIKKVWDSQLIKESKISEYFFATNCELGHNFVEQDEYDKAYDQFLKDVGVTIATAPIGGAVSRLQGLKGLGVVGRIGVGLVSEGAMAAVFDVPEFNAQIEECKKLANDIQSKSAAGYEEEAERIKQELSSCENSVLMTGLALATGPLMEVAGEAAPALLKKLSKSDPNVDSALRRASGEELIDGTVDALKRVPTFEDIRALRKKMPGISDETAELLLKRHPCLLK